MLPPPPAGVRFLELSPRHNLRDPATAREPGPDFVSGVRRTSRGLAAAAATCTWTQTSCCGTCQGYENIASMAKFVDLLEAAEGEAATSPRYSVTTTPQRLPIWPAPCVRFWRRSSSHGVEPSAAFVQ